MMHTSPLTLAPSPSHVRSHRAPRALRHYTSGPTATLDPDSPAARLAAIFHRDPANYRGASAVGQGTEAALSELLGEITPPPRTEPRVPDNVHAAMHGLILRAGELREQFAMERALSEWLGWNPSAFRPTVPTGKASGRERYLSTFPDSRTPSTDALRERVAEAHRQLSESPEAPSSWRELGRALAALRDRLAETSETRRARLDAAEVIPGEAATVSPTVHTDPDPPPQGEALDLLTRRANLEARPTGERLTRTLALAPGAPNAAGCA